jgi:hypothetical protein
MERLIQPLVVLSLAAPLAGYYVGARAPAIVAAACGIAAAESMASLGSAATVAAEPSGNLGIYLR